MSPSYLVPVDHPELDPFDLQLLLRGYRLVLLSLTPTSSQSPRTIVKLSDMPFNISRVDSLPTFPVQITCEMTPGTY